MKQRRDLEALAAGARRASAAYPGAASPGITSVNSCADKDDHLKAEPRTASFRIPSLKRSKIDTSELREQRPQFKYQQYLRIMNMKKKGKKRGNVKDIIYGNVKNLDPEDDEEGIYSII